MRIEFWLDYLCPITYLTHKNLTEALTELEIKDYEFYYRSLQIKENINEGDYFDIMMEHHCTQDKDELISFLKENYPEYEKLVFYNTNKAHQLAHLAKHNNLAVEYNTAVLDAYFLQHANISDDEVLIDIAKKVGLNMDEVLITLESLCYNEQIMTNKENARNRGIVEIPHLRVNMKNNFGQYLTKEEIVNLISDITNKSKKSKSEICGLVCDF